jgi:hypothetical protein
MPSTLDSDRELALMSSTVPRDTPRQDFAAFGHEIAEASAVFIINQGNFIGTEATNFLPQKPLTAA